MPESVSIGNPFKVKGRSCYYVKITLCNPTSGHKRFLKKSTEVSFDSPNALSKAHNVRLAILADYLDNHDPSAPLKLTAFADEYIKQREAEHLKERTIIGIRRAFDWLIQSVGKKRTLSTIVAADVREFLFKNHKSPSMAIVNYRYLHAAFDRAVKDERLSMNPFNQIDKKQLRKRFKPRPRGILTAKQVVSIYDKLPKQKFCDRTFANYFLLLFGTAFRRGEGCFLRDEHIDFTKKIILVRNTDDHELKTEVSEDDIPMIEHARMALKDQLKNKAGQKKESVRNSEVIFCNFSGEHYHADTMTKQVIRRVKLACIALDIDTAGFDLHSLRHSLIQHLLDSGAEAAVVSKLARHANLSTTLGAYHKVKDTKTTFKSVLDIAKRMPKPKK
jgi:integrase